MTSLQQLSLPIDACLPDVIRAVAHDGAVVVEAPPGAGKTTRVPRALLEAGVGDANSGTSGTSGTKKGEIWVLEPRRLPARLAATRVAAEMGEAVGATVGYSVRFDDVGGPQTRLRFMTEGLFLRRMLADPRLQGVAAVVLDELHERHVATDLALAWIRRLRETDRPDLAVVAMSATLDGAAVRAFLAGEADDIGGAGRRRGCALVRSEGRMFDVAVEHLPAPDDRPLALQVAGAVRRALREEASGDLLVFLPGAGEIRRAQQALSELPGMAELLVMPLHGDMPLEEQARAVRPANRRKIVLSTNVAESSVTIDGVVAVIDSGLARVATHSPWTGLPTLGLAKISRAAAIQRAGRAGRTRPGRALRLYTRHDFEQRRAHDLPEIARADLADVAVLLAVLGVEDPDDLAWLDAPPAPAWGAARELLGRLGALEQGRLSAIGRRLAQLPVHPRLARLVVEGEARGATDAACLAAALISERDIRAPARTSFGGARGGGPGGDGTERGAEIADLVDLYRQAEEERFRPDALRRLELDRRAVEEVGRVRGQLRQAVARGKPAPATDEVRALRLAVLTAFPDRVARRRPNDPRNVVFAGGGAATLGYRATGDWFVAVDVEERKRGAGPGGAEVRLGSAIEPEWLLDLYADRIEDIERRTFNAQTGWVERTSGLGFGALLLDESTGPAPADEETARLLADAALAHGIDRLPGGEALRRLLDRLAFARGAVPEAPLPAVGEGDLPALVQAACQGRRSFSELDDLSVAVLATLPPEAVRALDRIAPARVTLGGGRAVTVNYSASTPPWIESRLQDFFGTRAAPTIGDGRVPLTMHLLAPNGRAVQVTRDLASFWAQHYPPLRRELGRRYPRHAWPEDGATAKPPPPQPPRRR